MGDAVNLASRLQGITSEYGLRIIAGEATKKAAEDIAFREIDHVRVRGKHAVITIYVARAKPTPTPTTPSPTPPTGSPTTSPPPGSPTATP